MREREDELWDHLVALQAQIDRLTDADEARLRRIRRLEKDRQSLKRQLAEARRKWWETRRPTPTQADGSAPDPRPTLEVPGVGLITEPELPTTVPRRDLRVGTVLDPISATVFGPEFHSRPISATSWEQDIESTGADLLFVESAYQGHDGSWATRVARFGSPSDRLVGLVKWCRDHGVPTAFWNKEDPINFDWFIESARLFDHVFTVDGDQIPRYRSMLGHDRVHILQFFAQPAIHYPGPEEARTGTVAFAGSYFAAKHPKRRDQIEMLLDPAREFGLQIFDRHGDTDDPRFRWPDKYRPHIVGRLTYLQTVEAYRRYKVFLNVNTVTDSPTMCARRVFELAACRTPIVSGPALALDGLSKQIAVVRSAGEASDVIAAILNHEAGSVSGEWIRSGHTAETRLGSVLESVGLG